MTEPGRRGRNENGEGGQSGTAAARAASGAAVLLELYEQGHLADIDRHFASLIADLDGGGGPELPLAAALASAWTRDGHACIALPEVAGRDWPRGGGVRLPALDPWIEALEASPIVARPGSAERRPLVLDGRGRLYLERLWTAERTVAAGLIGLATSTASMADAQSGADEPAERDGPHFEAAPESGPQGLEAALDRLVSDTPSEARARAAARTAACRRLCVVSGGPGTGKTTIAAAIVALLVELRLAAPGRIALAAPTGKAAARLQEAVRERHRILASRVPALEGFEARATTVHRWLFSRDRERLPVDALILDEGSMVDVTLMAKVLAALPDGARLVVLGDASQLASVQPGAVFADVCRAGAESTGKDSAGGTEAGIRTGAGGGERATTAGAGAGGALGDGETGGERATVAGAGAGGALGDGETGGERATTAGAGAGGALGGGETGGAAVAAPSPLAPCVVELVHNWRFDESGGIGRLAAAVVRVDASAAVAALRDPSDDSTVLRPLPDSDRFEQLATTIADERFAPALRETQANRDPGGETGPLSAFRVLCAHRIGAFGSERFNRLVERRLRTLGLVPANEAFYPGRPILVTRNDPRTGLSNGDTGFVVRDAERRVRVRFPELRDAEGRPRLVAPSRLPSHESFFAVTVHRAQGSEYDEVAVALGPAESRIATRELLYTAVTRARRRVVVYGSEESVAAAVERATERSSGLREALGRSTPSTWVAPRESQ